MWILAILAFCSDYIDNIEMKNWACTTNIDALYKRMNVDERVENCVSENYDYYDYALALFFFDFVSKHMLFFRIELIEISRFLFSENYDYAMLLFFMIRRYEEYEELIIS